MNHSEDVPQTPRLPEKAEQLKKLLGPGGAIERAWKALDTFENPAQRAEEVAQRLQARKEIVRGWGEERYRQEIVEIERQIILFQSYAERHTPDDFSKEIVPQNFRSKEQVVQDAGERLGVEDSEKILGNPFLVSALYYSHNFMEKTLPRIAHQLKPYEALFEI